MVHLQTDEPNWTESPEFDFLSATAMLVVLQQTY